jgi:hypothetical protein
VHVPSCWHPAQSSNANNLAAGAAAVCHGCQPLCLLLQNLPSSFFESLLSSQAWKQHCTMLSGILAASVSTTINQGMPSIVFGAKIEENGTAWHGSCKPLWSVFIGQVALCPK